MLRVGLTGGIGSGKSEVARRLVAGADVLVENFRPGVMQRFGLDYERLRAVNPALVYCSISGFGQSGPRAKQGAYAPVVHALSGFDHVFMQMQERAETPPVSGIMIADVTAAVYAFGAIQTALAEARGEDLGSVSHGEGLFSKLRSALS